MTFLRNVHYNKKLIKIHCVYTGKTFTNNEQAHYIRFFVKWHHLCVSEKPPKRNYHERIQSIILFMFRNIYLLG